MTPKLSGTCGGGSTQLEAVLEDDLEIEPVKAEARRQVEDISEFLRKNPWRSQDCAQKCVRAVAMAIRRLHTHLGRAVDAQGKPHPVLQGFAQHLRQQVLIPSGRGGGPGGARIPRRPAAASPTSRRREWFGKCGVRNAELVTQVTGSVHL